MTAAALDVACLQVEAHADDEPAAVRARVLDALACAPVADTTPDLVVLPELWEVGYFGFDRYQDQARPLDDIVGALGALAAGRGSVLVGGSFVERDGDRLHNTVVAVGPDGTLLGAYRKEHLFAVASREAELLTPGRGPVVVDSPVGRLGLATCFDLRFPEHFAAMRDDGADVLVVPAAWPAARADHWRVLLQARAIETQTPVVGCNGAGDRDGVQLAGGSLVVDARGRLLAEAGTDGGWLTATLDGDDTVAWRREFPVRGAP